MPGDLIVQGVAEGLWRTELFADTAALKAALKLGQER
jgi:hypothetical protein